MSKIVREWLKNCATIHFLLLGIACGAIFDKVLKNLVLLHLDIFKGEGLISILKIWVFDRMFLKILINNAHFMCPVYQPFHDECLKKISFITFISSAIL